MGLESRFGIEAAKLGQLDVAPPPPAFPISLANLAIALGTHTLSHLSLRKPSPPKRQKTEGRLGMP